MEQNTDFDKLIIDYIQKTYKIARIKQNQRFRRAIILDDGQIYHLKDSDSTKKLKFKLGDYIELIFACDKLKVQKLISIALGI